MARSSKFHADSLSQDPSVYWTQGLVFARLLQVAASIDLANRLSKPSFWPTTTFPNGDAGRALSGLAQPSPLSMAAAASSAARASVSLPCASNIPPTRRYAIDKSNCQPALLG